MDSPAKAAPILIYDGFHRKTGKKSIRTTFKIFEDQQNILKRKYVGYSSVIIRLLLEKFISGELPDVEVKLEELKKQASEEIDAKIRKRGNSVLCGVR